MNAARDPMRLRHRRVPGARAQERQAAAGHAPAGDEDAVDHRQPGEQLADLIGAAQPAADPLVDGKRVTSSPKKRMRPVDGGKSPVTVLNSVVLPAPFEPRIARRSPAPGPEDRCRRAQLGRRTDGQRPRAPAQMRCWTRDVRRRCGPPRRPFPQGWLRSGAARIVAVGDAELQEVRLRDAERLIDRRDNFNDLVVEMPVVGLRDFRQIVVGDRLAVPVELDLAGGRVEFEMGSASRNLA